MLGVLWKLLIITQVQNELKKKKALILLGLSQLKVNFIPSLSVHVHVSISLPVNWGTKFFHQPQQIKYTGNTPFVW